MGSVGSSGITSISSRVDTFLNELNDREYGSGRKMVPKKQQDEFKNARAEISFHIKKWESTEPVIFASGFTLGDENYIHTTAKLNAYQRILKNKVETLKSNMKYGFVTKDEAEHELKVLKSLDAMIQDRRRILKRI